ncbi:MAG TPA: hypothetical protein GXX72_07800 [Clostridiaceae bacterium]|nr:hypothetical protein [Clostridiaceae bacterium]
MSKSNFIVRGGGDFSGLYKELNQAQKQLNGFKSGIGKTLKGIGALFGGIAVGRTIKDFVQTAARTETLAVAMNSVARASGYATAAVNEHKKAVMDMGIAEQESMQILTRFMQAQLDTADAAKLARVAQDAAVIANMNSSEAAEQMTEAIAKQRPVLLSQFGMTKNLNEIYKEYAARLGKTATQLTTAEKKQAMLNYILSEGDKIAGTYEASMGAVGKQIGSLPRYWDTLKNAIATPLALPGLSVAVEGVTNALKSAISWAEANEATLRVWGQNVANIVSGVVNAFSWITRTLANNWQMIKLVGTALVSYAAATKIVTAAVGAFKTTNLLLNGSLTTQIPLLSTASKAVAIYRTQMALAPVATNMFTGALLKLRVALQAVHAAIGPVGWAILAISALLTGGMLIWNKYNKSLADEELTDALQEIDDMMGDLEDTSLDATEGQEDLADGIGKASKAAQKALAPFDELNILQQNMGSGGGVPSLGGFGNLGNPFDGLNFEMPTLDTEKVDKEIKKSKSKWEGFLFWLNDKWNGLKQTFSIPITVPAPVFAAIPSPIYNPEWNLTPPLVPQLVFPPIIQTAYNKSIETIKNGMVNAKAFLEQRHGELVRNVERETRNWGSRVNEGLSTAWSTIERNYNTHKENVGVIATAVGTTMAVNVSRGLSTMGRNINNAITTVQNNLNTFGTGVSSVAAEIGRTLSYNISQGFNTVTTNFASFVNNMGRNVRTFGAGMLTGALETARGFASNLVNGFQRVWSSFRSLMSSMGERVGSWWNANKSVVGKVAIGVGVGAAVATGIALAAPAAIPFAAKGLGALKAISAGAGLAFGGAMAKGGIVNEPTLAVIGEAGKEAVMPLENNTGWIDDLSSRIANNMGNKSNNNNDGSTQVIEVHFGNDIYRKIINGIEQEGRRAGRSVITIG